MATRTLQIVVAGDDADALRSFGRVEKAAGRMGDKLDREGKRARGFATITSTGFARVGAASTAMQAVAGGAVALMAKKFVDTASDINESLTKNQVLFGRYADDVVAFSDRSAKSFGISKAAALEYTGVFGNLFRALDVSREKAAGMSVGLTKLAADMASFNNTSIEDALEAIRSGIVGEVEPLRRFGVNLNDAQLRIQAVKLGLTDTTKNVLTPYQRSMAAVALITKQTAAAHGDFHRTAGGLANQTRILQARLSDTAAAIGAKLLPFALRATTALNNLISETQKGRGPLVAMARAVSDVSGEVSETVGWFRRHRTATTVLMAAVTAATAAFVTYKTVQKAVTIATGAMTAAQVALNVVMRANPIVLVVSAVAALGTAMVVAYKRSNTFRRIVDGAFKQVQGTVQTLVSIFNHTLLPVFQKIVDIGGKVAGVLGKIGGAFGTVGGLAKGAAGILGPFGDGLGQVSGTLANPGGSANLMGADPDLLPFASIASRMGLQTTSGLRPGAITSSGNVSYHSSGDAIDESGPPSAMLRFFNFMKSRFGSNLRELIYTPGGVGIKDGRPFRYTGQVARDHYNHVHVAYTGPFGDGIGQAVQAARAAGFRGQALINAVAIAGAESRYDAQAQNLKYPDHSIGMWQINQLAHHGRYGSDSQLKNPFVNARAAWAISNHGRNWSPWSTWPSAAAAYMSRARAAISGGGGGGAAGGGGGGKPSGPLMGTFSGGGGGGGKPKAGLGPGLEGQLAFVGVSEAQARASDNLANLIGAEKQERAIKKRRLRRINRLLRRNISRKLRTALLQEKAQLIGDIADLNAEIKEYVADQKGGATTISEADTLDAGVNPNAGVTGGGGDVGGGTDSGVAQAIGELKDEMARTRRFNEWMVNTQGPTLVSAVLSVMNNGFGQPLGLSLQGIRSQVGSTAGL